MQYVSSELNLSNDEYTIRRNATHLYVFFCSSLPTFFKNLAFWRKSPIPNSFANRVLERARCRVYWFLPYDVMSVEEESLPLYLIPMTGNRVAVELPVIPWTIEISKVYIDACVEKDISLPSRESSRGS